MLSVKQQSTCDMLDGHLGAVLVCAGLSYVHHGRDRREMDPPIGRLQSVTEVSLLAVHKERLVETANGFEGFAANDYGCSHDPWDGLRLGVRPSAPLVISKNRQATNELTRNLVMKKPFECSGKWVAR